MGLCSIQKFICVLYMCALQLSCETEFINTQNHELDQLGEASTQSPGSKRRRRQAAEVANVTEVVRLL